MDPRESALGESQTTFTISAAGEMDLSDVGVAAPWSDAQVRPTQANRGKILGSMEWAMWVLWDSFEKLYVRFGVCTFPAPISYFAPETRQGK
jgi:hypothetical protein